MFNFTALLGAQSDTPASQSLLELDGGIKILVDVGWDEPFDVEKLQALEKHVSTTSIILLTHPTLDHLGAFAHCCKHIPQFASIPVYATSPVISLGRTLLQDLYASSPLAASIIPNSARAEGSYGPAVPANGSGPNLLLPPPTTEEIASYFSLINPLKYSQPHQPIPSPFSPALNGLTVTAYNAGHTLGGTIWHIQHGLESIVYAVDWNQAKENTLSGAAWLGSGGGGAEIIEPLRRPTALVCSSKGVERSHTSGGRKKRDEALLTLVQTTISNGGTVLIPSDSSARILELAYILEQHWRNEIRGPKGDVYRRSRLALASKSIGSTLRFARSMVEWMDEGIVREMEIANDSERTDTRGRGQKDGNDSNKQGDQTPLDFRHMKLIERKTQMARLLSSDKPGVILASDRSLEWGFSSEAIRRLASDPKNLVILTERAASSEGTPRHKTVGQSLWRLWNDWAQQHGSSGVGPENLVLRLDGVDVVARDVQTARLEGDENLFYQQYLARRRQVHSTQQGDNAAKEVAADVADDESTTSSESSEESEDEQQGRALNVTASMMQTKRKVDISDADLGINILLRRKNVYDYDVRGRRGREKMFPFATKRSRNDEFGDVIRPEEYLRAEERDEVDGLDMKEVSKGEATVGQKRKWDDVGPQNVKSSRGVRGTNKRQRTDVDSRQSTNGALDGVEDEAASESEESDYEPEETAAEGPLKVVITGQTLKLRLGIAYVDFSALHEKRDLEMLIPLIRPRKLILTAGQVAETQSLAVDLRALLEASEGGIDVFAPAVGESVDASVNTNAWTLKLSRDLVKRLTWQNVKGLSVVAVTGRLGTLLAQATDDAAAAEESRRKKLKLIQGDAENTPASLDRPSVGDGEPVLDIVSSNLPANNQLVTQPIHVGDLRLADLRRLMQATGHTAEFRGEGTLVVDDIVVVRKSASGRIEMEGGGYMTPGAAGQQFEGTFFAVRRQIYEGLAVVAGG